MKKVYNIPLETAKKLVSYNIENKNGELRPVSSDTRGITGKQRLEKLVNVLKSGEETDPIEIGRVPGRKPHKGKIGDPSIIDGHHRVMAHIAAGKTHIKAQMPEEIAKSLGINESRILKILETTGEMGTAPTPVADDKKKKPRKVTWNDMLDTSIDTRPPEIRNLK